MSGWHMQCLACGKPLMVRIQVASAGRECITEMCSSAPINHQSPQHVTTHLVHIQHFHLHMHITRGRTEGGNLLVHRCVETLAHLPLLHRDGRPLFHPQASVPERSEILLSSKAQTKNSRVQHSNVPVLCPMTQASPLLAQLFWNRGSNR
jgi:hypothetical protein